MRTSENFAALFGDHQDHGDVVIDGRFADRNRVWVRVKLLRTAIEGATSADHPSDVFDAAHELAQIVGALLAEPEAGPWAVAA